MENLYGILKVPTKENLHENQIKYFDEIFDKYHAQASQVITYINECYNYHSPVIVQEKDWDTFLKERFDANFLSPTIEADVLGYESPEVVLAIDAYLEHQHQKVWKDIVTKEQLKRRMTSFVNDPTNKKIAEIREANTTISEISEQLKYLYDEMRQDQKSIGNYRGYETLQNAKKRLTVVNIGNLLDTIE